MGKIKWENTQEPDGEQSSAMVEGESYLRQVVP